MPLITFTDSGYVDETNRFVDTSANVVGVVPVLEIDEEAISNGVFGIVQVFASNINDDVDDWPLLAEIHSGEDVVLDYQDLFLRFKIILSNPNNYAYSEPPFKFYVRMEISDPIMAPLYEHSALALDKLPEWMAMREIDNRPEQFGLATPVTIGGQFFNSIAGEWLDQISKDITYLSYQSFIGTVDINQADWVYVWDLHGSDGNFFTWFATVQNDLDLELIQAGSITDFLNANKNTDLYFWDEANHRIYTRKSYGHIKLFQYGVGYEISNSGPFHIWNHLDELGLLVDLERLHLETNEIYRKRILDVYANKPGPGIEAFKLALRRELDLWRAEGATPDSEYEGALPIVLEIGDLEADQLYTMPNGLATAKFRELVSKLAKDYPTTWGRFYWDKAYWDIAGEDYTGFGTLPTQLDVSPVYVDDTEYGVGDFDDLYLHRPDAFTGPHEFSVRLQAKGRRRETIEESYPTVKATLKLTGYCDAKGFDNPVVDQWVTIVVYFGEDEMFYGQRLMSATSDLSFTNPKETSSSFGICKIFSQMGYLDTSDQWIDGTDHLPWDPDTSSKNPHISEASDVLLIIGNYNPVTEVQTDLPIEDVVDVFYSTTPLDSVGDPIESLGFYDTASILHPLEISSSPFVYLRSRKYNMTTEEWTSEPQFVDVEINGGWLNEENPIELVFPPFEWPIYLDDPPNKRCLIEVDSRNSYGQFGGFTTDANGDEVFLDVSYINIDGSHTWPVAGHGVFVNYPPDSDSVVPLLEDDFEKPDADWLGFTLDTQPDGYPLGGAVPWMHMPESAGWGKMNILNGNAQGSSGHEWSGALLYTDIRDSYSGGNVVDPPQARIKATIEVGGPSEQDKMAGFYVKGKISTTYTPEPEIHLGGGFMVAFANTAMAINEDSEAATPLIAESSPYDYGTNILDVRVDIIGDLLVVYVEGDLVLMTNIPEDYWTNKVFGVFAGENGKILDFSIEGVSGQELDRPSVEVSTSNGSLYPLDALGWEPFTANYSGNYIKGLVDENGPWRNDIQPSGLSSHNTWKVLNLARSDFAIPDSSDYVVTWIGLDTVFGARTTLAWLESNVVIPANVVDDTEYPENAITEIYDDDIDVYGFGPIIIKAKLRPEPATQWYPQLNSGWYFMGEGERYAYANRKDESFLELATPSGVAQLASVPRQGAPIMVRTTQESLISYDSFNRPDNGVLGFTDGDGVSDPLEWLTSEWSITNGRAKCVGGSGLEVASLGVDLQDQEVVVTLDSGDGFITPVYLGMRMNGGNGYAILISQLDSSGYTVNVGRFASGDLEVISAETYPYKPSVVSVSIIGYTITVKIDGDIISTVEDSEEFSHSGDVHLIHGVDNAYTTFELRELNPDYTTTEYRQTSFVDPSDMSLTNTNTELLRGNGTSTLYLAYEDVYDVNIHNITTDTDVTGSLSSSTNEVNTLSATDPTNTYRVSYKVNNTFYLDLDLDESPQSASLVFDLPPEEPILVTYEESIYNPTQFVDLPLSPMHTRIEEGFVFVTENEYDLARVEVSYGPQRVMSNEYEIVLFNITTLDGYGNPKPFQHFSIESDWGSFLGGASTISTNWEGFAQVALYGQDTQPDTATPGSFIATISFVGDVSFEVSLEVQPEIEVSQRLIAVPSSEELPADGFGTIYIHGRITNPDFTPASGEVVHFRKGRSIYDVFSSSVVEPTVTTNSNGEFTLGPFTVESPENPGTWFVAVEKADGSCGDVVFWREFPLSSFGIDDMTGLPISDIQMATPISDIPPYAPNYKFPYSYDEDVIPSFIPTTIDWVPPRWYMLDWFLQYQLGIVSGDEPNTLHPNYADEGHNPYRLGL